MKKELIIFDLDGTLVDAFEAVTDSVNFALKKMNLPLIEHERIKRSVGWGEKILIEKLIGPELAPEALDYYRGHHKIALKTGVCFLPGAGPLIEELQKENKKLAIASNRPFEFSSIILKTLKVYDCFDLILCADQVAKPKPSGVILKEILKRLNINSQKAVYVGDMGLDVQTARVAKVTSVAVLTGSCPEEEIRAQNPDYVISQISQLKEIIG